MKKVFPILCVILVFPAIFQLLLPGLFVTDDADWMIIRFTSFYQELSNFQIPVRFLNRLNFEYGYPVATFLYPGFMYIAALFKLIGLGFIVSVKAVLILSVFSGFFGMFLFLKNHFSKFSALVGACLYIYNPYFLWDIYKRGSVGEVLALGIVPLILYCIDSDRRVIASILTALLLISHNTIAFLFVPFILFYLLLTQFIQKVDIKVILSRMIVYGLVTLGISAFFWIPVLVELPLTVFKSVTVSNFLEYFVSDQMLIGIINWFIVICSLVYILVKRKYSLVLYFMTGVSLLSLFLSTEASSFLWSDSLLGKFVQFPFRFLSLFAFTTAYLGAFLFSGIKQYIPVFATLLVGLIIVAVFPLLSNVERKEVEDSFYATNVDTTTVKNEYMPIWVKSILNTIPAHQIERLDEDTVQINTIYWPGHEVRVDEKKLIIDYSNDQGVMRVETDAPLEKISVVFRETTPRMISNVISFVFLFLAAFLSIRKNKYV